ncbi:DUF427 domain-containing protein [Nocardia brasiliensis]|uniref:DUF427 domain-containing protein n=1 Tax=Nocardia brasiliensis (strain ATCC 700358 / HUJEG-1) TaxID=1133849 RepID=K0ES01_NOCB7|nr:DUF427 domain-containing protein [Nocardia brasiliensis]AFT98505.1 hypothetical protein O3I_002715 [Nocardia brasiliensis ATCC 700358]OCF88809.1 hypothetical protein AW168_17625 [Nocardia brasiliensis]
MGDTQRGRVKIETSQKRVRVFLGGRVVADTAHPVLVWESPHYPTYYLPVADLHAKLEPTGSTRHSPSRGDAAEYDVVVDGTTAPAAALRYHDSPLPELNELVRLEWNKMDEWFEEDEPVYVHPRDPYTRVDVLGSSRHVRVEIDGVTVADSHSPRILFETGLPARYYLPMTDVRMDLLHPSDTHTSCPYKGTADYWTVRVGEQDYQDYVWGYRTPLPESQKVAGLVCFYNEKVDIYLDGELQERPRSPFS